MRIVLPLLTPIAFAPIAFAPITFTAVAAHGEPLSRTPEPTSVAAEAASETAGKTAEMTPEQARAQLNREQAEAAQQQNAASRKTYDEAVMAREQLVARQQAEYETEKTRLQREHVQAMERWRTDAEACKAGKRDKCAPAR